MISGRISIILGDGMVLGIGVELAGLALSMLFEWLGPKIPRAVPACSAAGFQSFEKDKYGNQENCDNYIRIMTQCQETVRKLIDEKENSVMGLSRTAWYIIIAAVVVFMFMSMSASAGILLLF